MQSFDFEDNSNLLETGEAAATDVHKQLHQAEAEVWETGACCYHLL